MKKVLMTGGSGFVGRNIRAGLARYYELDCPTRKELNLLDEQQVYEYIRNGKYDYVLHSANPNPVKNELDQKENFLADSMRIFMNLYRAAPLCEKLFYFGSGAEYDKRFDLKEVCEEKILEHIPEDAYGLSKLYMNLLAINSPNIYNLRLFGCYGPFDHSSKFLTHVIRCILRGEDISIRQDCFFDYLQVFDLVEILRAFFEQDLQYHDYNVCTGTRIALSEIAEKIREQMGSTARIMIGKSGMNKEYTASNKRMLSVLPADYSFTSIDEGIRIQIRHETETYRPEDN